MNLFYIFGLQCLNYVESFFFRIVISMVVICGFSMLMSDALANPTGGQVTAGSATILNVAPTTVQIKQTSNKAIINWRSFDIGAQEKTQFIQPSAHSIALNRIDPTQGASKIFGTLTANGSIILINQAGVFFGPSAYVNVAGIIVSTSDITNQNFLAGQYIFDQPSLYAGSIVNEGVIIAAEHGLVALIGTGISNTGTISANLGSVVLAAGDKFVISLSGDQLINFTVSEKTSRVGIDAQGKPLKNGVYNSGTLIADGGRIIITAKVAQNIVDNAINLEGVAQARSVLLNHGEIILSSEDGVVRIGGHIDASAATQNKGGVIKVLAKTIYIDAPAVIDASGGAGGGEILIGGNLQGLGPEPNANETVIGRGATMTANALTLGNGGKIIVWSNNLTDYKGNISATGGMDAGGGGFVEVSGHHLNFQGTVNLSAANGLTGTLLLDPENLTIQSVGPTTATASGSTYTANVDNSILTVIDLQAALANANVLVQTGLGGLEAGDITVADSISWSNQNTLTLSAFRNININAGITNSSSGGLTLKADNTGTGIGTVAFSDLTPQITMSGGGAIQLYYNPASFPVPTNFSNHVAVSGGTVFTPYMLVNSLTDLQNINNNLSGNYALSKNIDASPTSGWNAGAGFVPIGTSASNFTGQFEGQNHIIDSLTIFLPTSSSVGLFGYVNSSGAIQNVGLTQIAITGLTDVGGLIGFNAAGTVNNAYSTGSVTSDASSTHIGGLIGFSGGDINDSYSTATVLAGATSNYIGGLVGQAMGNIYHSYHDIGSVTAGATSHYVGGLAGYSQGSVSHSYNTGPVSIGATGSTNVGGLLGYSVGTVSDSYSTGSVTAGAAVSNVGGLIGYGFGKVNSSYSTGAIITGATGSSNIGGLVGFAGDDITNSYSHSSISAGAANSNVGGLVGQNNAIISNTYSTGLVAAGAGSAFLGGLVGLNNSTVINSFWDTQTSGLLVSDGGTGKTTTEMMQQTTFCPSGSCNLDPAHFDFANNWEMINGETYPYLQSLTQSVSGYVYSNINAVTPVANSTITLVSGGVTLNGLAISESQAISDITGFYYFLLNRSYFSEVDPLLAYLSLGSTVGNTLFTPTTAPITANIYGNTISNQGAGTLSNTLLASTIGSISDPGILYSATGNNLTLGNATHATADFLTAIDTPYTINGNLTPFTGGLNNFIFNGPVAVVGNTIVLAGQTFTNNSAEFTLNPGGGTFLVWSNDPANDNRGGIIYDFKQYNAVFGITPVLGSGTGFLYTLAPVIIPSLTGTVTKPYDATTSATLTSSNYAITGAVDGDTVLLNNPTSGNYDTKNVGTNKNVSVSGLAIESAANGSATVYGYQLNSTSVNANIGIITPASLTYTANLATTTYGSLIPPLSGTVTGFVSNETQANATTGTLTFLTPATSSSAVGSYLINGSGLTANNGNYLFTQALGNVTALTIDPATLTYTANPDTMTYGSEVPLLSGTVTGFMNNQTQANSTTGTLTFLTPATSSSAVGIYLINGSGLTANSGNYLFSQMGSNSTAFSITPSIQPTPVPIIPTPTLPSLPMSTLPIGILVNIDTQIPFPLIPNIVNPQTSQSNLYLMNSEVPNLSIVNFSDSIAKCIIGKVGLKHDFYLCCNRKDLACKVD